jgi:transposase
MPRLSPCVIELTASERQALETMARKYTAPYRDVVRAKVILLAADGWQNDQIAARLDMPTQHVSKWRKRFCHERLAGLIDRPRRGRPARASRRGPEASPVRTLLG